MSYMQFRQQCGDCKQQWNAAFGIVGMTQIAAPPVKCPHCGSENLSKIMDCWMDGTCTQHGEYKGKSCPQCEPIEG